ncbi:MAG: malonyl-CoA decarboxylase [Hyphomicrobiaceae bacterium]|nr:malonyl-CoA decarboxylase [Hyphomicrobiaceae bacterium]
MPVNVSFLQELLTTVAERGRSLLDISFGGERKESITDQIEALVAGAGEASGVARAREILDRYKRLPSKERGEFFAFIASRLRPDLSRVRAAAEALVQEPGEGTLAELVKAVESPRQEFFRRLNLAPGATAELVAMRKDLLARVNSEPSLAAVDADLKHLLTSWFNRGFLVLRRIDWNTPAAILEKIIRYEAVHEIHGFDDLRRRLDPVDRRCFAFFHPALIDEPLIFVEVALTSQVPGSIQLLLGEESKAADGAEPPTTAVFYSISNCQEGLRGISFGSFLIKQVVEELVREIDTLKTFVTLSPAPNFARWLDRVLANGSDPVASEADRVALQVLKDPGWVDEIEDESTKDTLLALAAHYYLRAKTSDGRPIDPVARFHLGNGARLERVNWLGDVSSKGLGEAHGLMVNYRYDLKEIERNHEAYANDGVIAASRGVRALLRPEPKPQGLTVSRVPAPGTVKAIASDPEHRQDTAAPAAASERGRPDEGSAA